MFYKAGIIVAWASLWSSHAAAGAHWSDDEITRRFARGVELSTSCQAESLTTKQVTGNDCLAFSTWLTKDFPALTEYLPGVMQRSPATAATYAKFVETLEAITAIGELTEQGDPLLDRPRTPL